MADDDREDEWWDRVDGARVFHLFTLAMEGVRLAVLLGPTVAALLVLWSSPGPSVAFALFAGGTAASWLLARVLEERVVVEYTGSTLIRLGAPATASVWLLADHRVIAGVAIAAGTLASYAIRRSMARDDER